MNGLNIGVNIDDKMISILLHVYADDIVLLSETQEGLQKALDAVFEWGQKYMYMIKFNEKKSNIVQY